MSYDIQLPEIVVHPIRLMSQGQMSGWGRDYMQVEKLYKDRTGPSAVIFILDTMGHTDHPDLVDTVLNEHGINFSDSDTASDRHGHGTHCAGICSASDNGIGLVGIDPKSYFVPVKVLNDNGAGFLSDIAKGIRYAANIKLPKYFDNCKRIISMSLGAANGSATLEAAVNYAISKGCILVAAAGNDGYDGEKNTVSYPAKYEGVIAVASIESDEQPSPFSSGGEEVYTTAPGSNIYSTYTGHGYAYLSGTSMATPMLVGFLSLICSVYPDKTTYSELTELINYYAKDLGTVGRDNYTGLGVPIADKPLRIEDEEAQEQPKQTLKEDLGLIFKTKKQLSKCDEESIVRMGTLLGIPTNKDLRKKVNIELVADEIFEK